MSVPQRLFCWIVLGLCADGNILLLLQLRLFNQSKKTKAVEHALDAVNLVEVMYPKKYGVSSGTESYALMQFRGIRNTEQDS